jgi:hypothetical protein
MNNLRPLARLLGAEERRRGRVGKESSLPSAICEFRASSGSPLLKCGERLSTIRNKLCKEEREVQGVSPFH